MYCFHLHEILEKVKVRQKADLGCLGPIVRWGANSEETYDNFTGWWKSSTSLLRGGDVSASVKTQQSVHLNKGILL